MADTKFTSGPWRAWQPRGDESVPVRTDGLGITIAYVHQGAITNARANANLIASAPDLYSALTALLNKYVGLVRSGDAGFWDPEAEEEVINSRDALAKARGEA